MACRCEQNDQVMKLAQELGMKIPSYSLSTFVQKKMPKVKELIKVARTIAECNSDEGQQAIERLEAFVEKFEAMAPDDIQSLDDWNAFVGSHANAGWEGRLHFGLVLSNFGFDEQASIKLRETKHAENGEMLEQYSLRWLSKALSGYNIQGSLADVVNLVFAMGQNAQPQQLDEEEVRTRPCACSMAPPQLEFQPST